LFLCFLSRFIFVNSAARSTTERMEIAFPVPTLSLLHKFFTNPRLYHIKPKHFHKSNLKIFTTPSFNRGSLSVFQPKIRPSMGFGWICQTTHIGVGLTNPAENPLSLVARSCRPDLDDCPDSIARL
jgi:hypothetical protein